MAYNPVYRKKRFRIKWSQFLPMLLFFCAIIGVSFYAGVLWARMDIEKKPGSGSSSSNQSSSGPVDSSERQSSGSSSSSSESSQDPSGSGEEEAAVAVSKGEYMSRSYFDDAVFVGDSITHGLAFYGLLDSQQVVAGESVNLETALYKTPYTNSEGQAVSVFDAVKAQSPKKIYVMLGTNGIEWTDKEKLASMYESLIVKLKEAVPDAIIYIQSVLPVTKELNDNVNRDLTNEKINAFNDLLLELAQKEQVYYLNVAEDFRDSQGNLPEEASPVDGIHFTVAYYQKWIEYLRYHTVEGMSVPEASESSQPEESGSSSAAQMEGSSPQAV